MKEVFIAAAYRTAVVPKGGAFGQIEVASLAAEVLRKLAAQLPWDEDFRLEVILGNALYGGGNPARVAALAAGLPENVPSFTLDTQCCSGLDAISYGASRIASGTADAVLAGGLESYSRAPLRYRRPHNVADPPEYYSRPPFTPWKDRDPDLIESAAQLAAARKITRTTQEEFTISSHRKALAAKQQLREIITIDSIAEDTFARALNTKLLSRLPAIAGVQPYELTAATIAVEADAAAAVLLVNERILGNMRCESETLRCVDSLSVGFDPMHPALAPVHAARELLKRNSLRVADLAVVEAMEAFAAQAMIFVEDMAINPIIANRGGGGLSRGHPIGASGAILAVRLFHEMQHERCGARGLAAIAAAGGLGSALLLERP
jgi:acetyl-CoA C-acetyltransferase